MHFNKNADVTNAMLRIADSLAYVAAARHVYVVVDDPGVEHRRLFVKAKNNLSPDNSALSYMTGVRKVGEDEETGEEIFAPYIIWGAEHVKVTATEAMQAEAEGGQSKQARNEASEFLITVGRGTGNGRRPQRRGGSQRHFMAHASARKKGTQHRYQEREGGHSGKVVLVAPITSPALW